MFPKLFFSFLIVIVMLGGSPSGKMYQKDYYDTGKLKAEGWVNGTSKSGYWKFYHPNGKKAEQGHYTKDKRTKYWYFFDEKGRIQKEGHYVKGKMADWWLFYNAKGEIQHKCQLTNGIKNGYCLKYMNEKLASAEKYKNGKKIKEWYSFSSFKKENNLSDLK